MRRDCAFVSPVGEKAMDPASVTGPAAYLIDESAALKIEATRIAERPMFRQSPVSGKRGLPIRLMTAGPRGVEPNRS